MSPDLFSTLAAAQRSQDMAPLLARSTHVRAVHQQIRVKLKLGQLDLHALYVQALFDPDVASMLVRRILSAMPRMNPTKAAEVLQLARLPDTRRIGWVAGHPAAADRLNNALDMILIPAKTKKIPSPNWPWIDPDA